MDERTQDFSASSADYATGASVGADLYGGEGPVSEADELEARAREIRAQEAREIEAEQERVRSREAREAHHEAMLAASDSLGRAIGNTIHISALLTWSPSKADEADQLVALAARNLADFRSHLAMATVTRSDLGTDQGQAQDPTSDVSARYAAALAHMREVHRQTGAMIGLLELDPTNTPALVAMERSVHEAQAFSAVMSQGLGMALDVAGMTR